MGRAPFNGRVKPRPMNGLRGGISGFLQRSLPKLIEDRRTNAIGLYSALRFMCTNYDDDYAESHYIKTWTGLEIPYSVFTGEAFILPDDQFNMIAKAIR